MEKRIGVVSIIIEDTSFVGQVNEILHRHASIIVGRMGIPYRERGISVIALIVDGTTDNVGSLTGQLGNIKGISVKSALSKHK